MTQTSEIAWLAPRTGEPMAEEPELARWLAERLSPDLVRLFFETFGGQRLEIPKRPAYLVREQRRRALLATALRVASRGSGSLTREDAEAVAKEACISTETVIRLWAAWKSRGLSVLEQGGSTDDATGLDQLRW